jgi:hypothetical protein
MLPHEEQKKQTTLHTLRNNLLPVIFINFQQLLRGVIPLIFQQYKWI